MERRLAAILAADVVGYSRLMAGNEEGTIAALKAHRAFIDAQIVGHAGRIFGTAGDSVIAEFSSPVQAVRCAIEIQDEMVSRNAALPKGEQMLFRVGIHLGDVVVEGNNLLGDGVNVAARLEALAPPGGICVSNSIAEQISGKVEAEFASAGSHELKNIAMPVEVWTWPTNLQQETSDDVVSKGSSLISFRSVLALGLIALGIAAGWLFWFSDSRPSNDGEALRIAVLPFDDFSTGEDKGWLSDAIAEGLITELARYREFLVISRNSSFSFRDTPTDIREIAQKLDADYIVEGSKQKSGDKLRVIVQLINGADGTHIWANEFNSDVGELFEVQSKVVQSIATQIGHEFIWKNPLPGGGAKRVSALHFFLLGNKMFSGRSAESSREAAGLYLKSIEADPNAPFGYAGMATLIFTDLRKRWVFPNVSSDELMKQGIDYAEKAIALDETYYLAQIARGDLHYAAGEHEEAVNRYQLAAKLNPSSSIALAVAADPLLYLDRVDEAVEVMERAMEINPIAPGWYLNNLSRVYWASGRCEEGAQAIRRRTSFRPWDYRALIVNLVCMGDLEGAKSAGERLLEMDGNFTVRGHGDSIKTAINNPGYLERWLAALRAAGLPEG